MRGHEDTIQLARGESLAVIASNLPVLIAFALVLAACASRTQVVPRVVDDGIVIEDVTLISPERQAPLSDADGVVRNGRIAQIGTGLLASGSVRLRVQVGRPREVQLDAAGGDEAVEGTVGARRLVGCTVKPRRR